jgi:uncharacterized membrane protein
MSGSRQTQVLAKGDEVLAQQHESDTPFLPVHQLEQLHGFRPDLVDWVIRETEREADYRRRETHCVNHYIFAERMLGMGFAFLLGMAGILGGGYLALNGQPKAGIAIATVTIGALAVAFLRGKSKNKNKEVAE